MTIRTEAADYMGKVHCQETEIEGVFISKETGEIIISQPDSCQVITTK